MLMAAAAAAAT